MAPHNAFGAIATSAKPNGGAVRSSCTVTQAIVIGSAPQRGAWWLLAAGTVRYPAKSFSPMAKRALFLTTYTERIERLHHSAPQLQFLFLENRHFGVCALSLGHDAFFL